MGGVPPMPFTITATSEPEKSTESPRILSSIWSTMLSAGSIFLRSMPGSPWMPTPISISSSAMSKMGSPLSGGVQLVSAIPIERTFPLTLSAGSLMPARYRPSSAAAAAPVRPRRELLEAGEVSAVVRGGAADLVHEDGTRDPPPAAGERGVLDRHVVVGDHVVGLYALGLGELAGHLEVEDVARIVLDDVEDPCPGGGGRGGGG